MQQLISVWLALDGRKRFIVLFSVLAMFVGVIVLSRLAATPSMTLLYSGLESASAGEVVQSLEQRGVAYDVRGASVFVEATRRDELRMTLAADGLPTLSGQGYELLDTLSGFGTTAQMFDAAYWRAKEGELARTIMAGLQFRTARVHISSTAAQPFRRGSVATASVTATGMSGPISFAHAKALKFLVASAVAGLSPENVSVIDGQSGTVVSGDDGSNSTSYGDRAIQLRKNIERLLEARVGTGNVVVEVNLETVTDREAITETVFDPDSRVAISRQIDERATNSNDSGGSAVTVASNLPDGDGAGSDKNSSSENSETSERINYEVSETRREILRVPGSIKRISTAVMVNGIYEEDDQTGLLSWSPRPAEEMQALEELVASAVGLNLDRGDSLTLKSMQFEQPPVDTQPAQASIIRAMNLDIMRLIQVMLLAVVTLVLGFFVLRPILMKAPVPPLIGNDDQISASSSPQLDSTTPGSPAMPPTALTGEIDNSPFEPVGVVATPGQIPPKLPPPGTIEKTSDPVERLRQMIENRQDETVEILRNWIEDGEEHV